MEREPQGQKDGTKPDISPVVSIVGGGIAIVVLSMFAVASLRPGAPSGYTSGAPSSPVVSKVPSPLPGIPRSEEPMPSVARINVSPGGATVPGGISGHLPEARPPGGDAAGLPVTSARIGRDRGSLGLRRGSDGMMSIPPTLRPPLPTGQLNLDPPVAPVSRRRGIWPSGHFAPHLP